MRMTTRGASAILLGLTFYSPAPVRAAAIAPPRLVALRTEYKENPLGIDAREAPPELAARVLGREASRQSAYEIRVGADRGRRPSRPRPRVDLGPRGLGRIHAARLRGPRSSVRAAVSLAGPRLGRRRHRLRLERARLLGDGAPRAVRLEGELDRARPGGGREDQRARAPAAQRPSSSSGVVERARAYVTSHGLYELHLNGRRVGDQLFTPGWTSYNKRLQYQTYDVTSLLKTGDNVVGACSATAGTAAIWAGKTVGTSTATAWPCWGRSRSRTRTDARKRSEATPLGRPRPDPC